MIQNLITKNAKMHADNIIVGIEDVILRKRLFVYANIIESLVDFFENIGFAATSKISLYKNTSISEKVDIADIYIGNLRADIRISDDTASGILIPKQHKELGIEPDLYLIVKLDDSFNSYEIQGFAPTEQIIFDKEIQDYYILNPKNIIPMDRFSKLSKSIQAKNIKSELNEKELIQLFLKSEEEDITLRELRTLLQCLLSNGNFARRINNMNKIDNKAKAIKHFPALLDAIKPTIDEEFSSSAEEVTIEEPSNIDYEEDWQEEYEDNKEESAIEEIEEPKETIETEPPTYQETQEEPFTEDFSSEYTDDILDRLDYQDFLNETRRKRKKGPLFLHIVFIILIGITLVFFGIKNKQEKTSTKKSPASKPSELGNAVIPKSEITIRGLSWGISAGLAQDNELLSYLNTQGMEIKKRLAKKLPTLTKSPTKKEVKVAIVFDSEGNYTSNTIKKSSGSKEADRMISTEIEDVLKSSPSKNIKASAPFIRAILLIKL